MRTNHMITCFLAVLVVDSCCASDVPVLRSTSQSFEIARVRLLPTATDPKISATRLYTSKDDGQTWSIGGTFPARDTSLPLSVRSDGRYQITARYFDPSGQPTPNKPLSPTVEVLVDSTPPEVTLEAVRGEGDQAIVTARIRDLSPNIETIALSWISADPEASRVDVPPAPAEYRFEDGELSFTRRLEVPKFFDVSFRLTAWDTVGQKAVEVATLRSRRAASVAGDHLTSAEDANSPMRSRTALVPSIVEPKISQYSEIDSSPVTLTAFQQAKPIPAGDPTSYPATHEPPKPIVSLGIPSELPPIAQTPESDRSVREMFELLLAARPGDTRLREAYADLLIETGNRQRGEMELRQLSTTPGYRANRAATTERIDNVRVEPEDLTFPLSADDVWSAGTPN